MSSIFCACFGQEIQFDGQTGLNFVFPFGRLELLRRKNSNHWAVAISSISNAAGINITLIA